MPARKMSARGLDAKWKHADLCQTITKLPYHIIMLIGNENTGLAY
jgi:hypothetical protein